MHFTRSLPWLHALCFLVGTTQARVALFELLEHRPEDHVRRDNHVQNRRQQQDCTYDLYLSILSAQPSNAAFCYVFDPTAYFTSISTVSATATT